ncbi:MAG: FG-GAP repeat protein [Candidatus Polarisedimenticolia bacterium]
MGRRSIDRESWTGQVLRAATLAALLLVAGPSLVFAQPSLVYVGSQVSGGNGDDWIQPGELLSLKPILYNAGTSTAMSISGTLLYLGTDPGITVTVPAATWPDMVPRWIPLPTNNPHFTLQVDSAVPCGTVLPFRLQISLGGMDTASFDIALKLGRKTGHDMTHDSIKRFDEQEATFWGPPSPGNHLGSATAIGDIDGDGFGDVILSRASTLFVVYGQARHIVDMDMSAPPVSISTFTGLHAASLATADVNGDGYDDIIAGGSSSLSTAGVVALIYGQAAPWPNTNLASTSPIAGAARFLGADAQDGFGFRVAAGDVNGDGYDDLVASANLGDSVGNTRAFAGEAYLIHGRAAPWPDADLLSPPPGVARFWGADAGDILAEVAVGDVNGDGFDDLLLGARFGESLGNQRPTAGEAYVVYGGPAVWTDTDLASPPAGVARLWGAPVLVGPLFVVETELTVAGSGDFDNDGMEDIVLSCRWGQSANRIFAGQIYVIFGRAAALPDIDLLNPQPGIIRILGEAEGDELGTIFSDTAVGDFNGDGYDDLAVGATQVSTSQAGPGATFLLHGGPSRWTDVDLKDRPSTVTVFRGVDRGDALGESLAAGDVNGDGYDDLLLGAPDADSINDSRPDAGEAYLWYGKPADTYYLAPPAGSTGQYIDISALKGATELALACDDCFVQLPIGFRFPYYAVEFDTLFVSSNGFLTFSQPSADFFLPASCMPETGGANHLVAPFWDDLNPGAAPTGGGVFALVQGTAPYRRLVIEWKDVPHATSSGTGTFEVILFETTGQIHFRYKDLIFGNHANNGALAVVGLENGTGAHGVAYSCTDPALMAGTALVRYVPTTPLFEEHGEQTQALWTPTGHWHDSTNSCEPDQHAGERGWYYGNAHTCSYSDGFAGALLAPTVQNFPADARLTFWSRLGTQVGFDLPEVQLSTTGTGGPYATLLSTFDATMSWKYGGVTNLFANATDTVDLQFHFSSDSSVSSLGWMVDDIQLVGCDAVGAPQVVQAVSYAPPQVCFGSSATADAFGSYCGDSIDPVRWQWFQDGAAIPGAEQETFTIPDALAPGSYGYSVEVTCGSGASAMSEPAPVTVVHPPDPVAPTLDVGIVDARPAPRLVFRWDDVAGADDYVVLQDSDPRGPFTTGIGSAPSGDPGLVVEMPAGDLVFFLVAGRNEACGLGPIH